MLAGSGKRERAIANLFRGVIFFGVPSRGMPVNDIATMLENQPNMAALVNDISEKSEYLNRLQKQFTGASLVRSIKLFWAYETKTSGLATVRLRKGPKKLTNTESYKWHSRWAEANAADLV